MLKTKKATHLKMKKANQEYLVKARITAGGVKNPKESYLRKEKKESRLLVATC